MKNSVMLILIDFLEKKGEDLNKMKVSFLDSIPWLKSHRPPLMYIHILVLRIQNIVL